MIDYKKVKCPECGSVGESRSTGLVKYSCPAYYESKCTKCGKKFDVLDEDSDIKVFMSDEEETPFLGGLNERNS